MSNTSMSVYGSSSCSVLAAAEPPKLARFGAADYARWRPMFLNYCVARGLKNALEKEIPQWCDLEQRVNEWENEELDEAIAHVFAPNSSSVKDQVEETKAKKNPDEEKMRKLIRTQIERSRQVYSALYEAMPAELQLQMNHFSDVPHGNANALWKWLAYQSKEDYVTTLFHRWVSLRQEDNESFDAYRARVNELSLLLERVGEKPSARLYAFKLLDQLLPHYGQAILTLKACGALNDAKSINWDNVGVLINNYEKSTVHSETSSSSSEGAIAAAAVGKAVVKNSNSESKKLSLKNHDRRGRGGTRRSSPPPPPMANARRAKMKELIDRGACFRCEKVGHFAFECTAPLPASKKFNRFQRKEGEGNNEAAHMREDDEGGDDNYECAFSAIAIRGCPLLMEDECEEKESHVISYAQARV